MGDIDFRTVSSDCSIASKFVKIGHDLPIGERIALHNNTYSIQIMIDIEQ